MCKKCTFFHFLLGVEKSKGIIEFFSRAAIKGRSGVKCGYRSRKWKDYAVEWDLGQHLNRWSLVKSIKRKGSSFSKKRRECVSPDFRKSKISICRTERWDKILGQKGQKGTKHMCYQHVAFDWLHMNANILKMKKFSLTYRIT